jgi:hypothetical protein
MRIELFEKVQKAKLNERNKILPMHEKCAKNIENIKMIIEGKSEEVKENDHMEIIKMLKRLNYPSTYDKTQ